MQTQLGNVRRFRATNDGGGLCSPGRWKKEVRELAKFSYTFRGQLGPRAPQELELEAFRVTSGGEANWKVVRDEGLQGKLLKVIRQWLEANTWVRGTFVGWRKALALKLLRKILEAAGDLDREFLNDAESGLPVGIPYPLQILLELGSKRISLRG